MFGCIVARRQSSTVSCTISTSLTFLSLPRVCTIPSLSRQNSAAPVAQGDAASERSPFIPRRVSLRFKTAGFRSVRPPHQPSHGGRTLCVLCIVTDIRIVMPVTGRRLGTSNRSKMTLTLSLYPSLSRLSLSPPLSVLVMEYC